MIEAIGGGTADRIHALSNYSLAAGVEIEFLSTAANAGTDAINLTGNDLGQFIIANDGANSLWGRGGNDIIYPLGGQDYIYFDTAPGPSNVDEIVGFTSVDDLIFLDDALFTGIAPGFLAVDAFASGPGMTTAGAGVRIFHNSTTGDLYWDPDGAGVTPAVRFANIDAGTPIFNYDFFIN